METKLSSIKSRKIFNSIAAIDEKSWNKVQQDRNIYLTYGYLQALEESMENEIDFYYSISFDEENIPVLISAFQAVTFTDKRNHNPNQLISCVSKAKSKLFTFNVLVCGNVFSDGENGFIHTETISTNEAINEMNLVSKLIKKENEKGKVKASLFLFKEFWAKKDMYGKYFKQHHFREFMIDVNMILPIREEWKTMDDYLFSLKTKYRTRAKSVYKKSKELVIKDLSNKDILKYSKEIETLFNNVAEKSNFSFGKIKPLAFAKLKVNLGDKFLLRAAFYNDKMVGFSTSLFNANMLEANYVGIDYDYNYELAIYQRLLYDYIEQAITLNAQELQLGRTSELIKSAIGAVPENMSLYAKHSNSIHNLVLKPMFHFISPSKFELRKPFKSEFTV